MADVIREFLIGIGYKVDAGSEKRFESSVRSATLQSELLGRAIAATAEKVFEGVQRISKSFEDVYWQAQRTQATVQGIRAVGYAASQLGSSAESAGSSIENFGKHLKWNPGFEGFLKQIGVVTQQNGKLRDSTELLRDFANAIKGRPKAEQMGLAEVAGIDLATLEAIQSGQFQKRLDEYNEKIKAQGLNSEEAAKKGAEFMQSMKSLNATLEVVGQRLMTELAGPLQKFVDAFEKWTRENGKETIEFFKSLGRTIDELATFVGKAIAVLKPLWEGFNALSKELTGQNGLTTAIEVLIGLKLAQWLIGVAAAITGVGTAAAGALIGGSLGKFFALLAGPGAFLLGMTPSTANGGEDAEIARRKADGTWGKTPTENGSAPSDVGVKAPPAKPKDERTFWEKRPTWMGGKPDPAAPADRRSLYEKIAPKVLGGKDAPSGGTGGATSQKVPTEGRALLDTIASTEANGYDVMYGGGKFTDFSDHPRQGKLITSGPNAGKRSTAAGRYQFLASTWDQQAKKLGLKDFTPESQDIAAFDLARTAYKQNTGRDLAADLKSEDPKVIAGVGSALAGIWTSLPGGIEQGQGGGRFVSSFNRYLQRQQSKAEAGAAAAGGGPSMPPLARMNSAALGLAADNAAKLGGGSGVAAGTTLTPSTTSRGDTTVTLTQHNKIEVMGSGDPTMTANQVGAAQKDLGGVLLRDVRGAVR